MSIAEWSQTNQGEVLKRWGFEPFPVGKINTPLPDSAFKKDIGETSSRIRVSVPGRFNCLIKDPVALVKREPTGEFNYGEISFGVRLMTHAEAHSIEDNELVIGSNVRRSGLVRHFAEIMMKSINYQGGIYIEANNDFPYSHIGSGSSAALATATALAINKLAGEPVKIEALPLFLAQNYGEEIKDSPNLLVPVQCTGGTSLMALHGGLIAVEDNKLTQRMEIPEGLVYVIGIPNFSMPDSKGSMTREAEAVFQHILDSARYMQPFFAQRFQEIRAAMTSGDIKTVGSVIEMVDSDEVIIQGYENMFPGISEQYKSLTSLLQTSLPISTFISSAGPSFVTICSIGKQEEIAHLHRSMGFKDVIISKPANQGFKYET